MAWCACCEDLSIHSDSFVHLSLVIEARWLDVHVVEVFKYVLVNYFSLA